MLYIISGKNGLGSSGPGSIAQLSMIRANGLEPPVYLVSHCSMFSKGDLGHEERTIPSKIKTTCVLLILLFHTILFVCPIRVYIWTIGLQRG